MYGIRLNLINPGGLKITLLSPMQFAREDVGLCHFTVRT